MDKKGTASYVVGWLMRFFFVLFPAFIVIMFLKAEAINIMVSTHNLENSLLFNRVFYSRNSVFAVDEVTGRLQFGVVDMARFNEDTLKALFDEKSEEKFGFKLVLEADSMQEIIYYNEKIYKYVEARYGNPQKVNIISGTIPVKIINGASKKGYLTVSEGFLVKT